MAEKVIYNCHNHLFTDKHIPSSYYPYFLVPAARNKVFRALLSGTMKLIVPWSKNDKVHRYSAFLKATYRTSQEKNLECLTGYYPPGTRFVILPMDMELMGAGKVREGIDQQHAQLAELSRNPKYKDVVIPFAHIDPRRDDSLSRLKRLVESDGFRGVKIYPTLGYAPSHPRLMAEIYPYMVERNIPLLAHCSPGVVNSREISIEEAHALADPDNYKTVMDAFPELRICLGHFGGIGEWRRHLNEPRDTANPTWLTRIVDLMKSGQYKNLYADISYTIFNFQDNLPLLDVLLEEPQVLDRTLFGSDFYMVESEKYSEKRLSVDLRHRLREEKFWKIANENPKRFLGIQ